MSDPRTLRRQIEADLQRAPSVLYLEGETDVQALFALLGVQRPRNDIHEDVVVVGLKSGEGSGASAVRARVKEAAEAGYRGVFGVVDGDGRPFSELCSSFDPPDSGPVFSWKAYCIENLLAKAAWPPAWGPSPDWPRALQAYAPYVALNRLHWRLRDHLRSLQLHSLVNPGTPLLNVNEILARLDADRHLLTHFDVRAEFMREIGQYQAALDGPLDEVHAQLNGKWLMKHFAPHHTRLTPERCRDEWCEAARGVGPHPDLTLLWSRLAA